MHLIRLFNLFVIFCLVVFSAFKLSAETNIPYVYLTWKNDPATTMVVHVHQVGSSLQPLTLHYGPTSCEKTQDYPFSLPLSLNALKDLKSHVVCVQEITGLSPGTNYFFRIHHPLEGATEEFSFKTLNPSSETLVFIEGGDWEPCAVSEELALLAAAQNPDFLLLGGDYPGDVNGGGDFHKWDAWLRMYSKTMKRTDGSLIPMILAIGNHEVIGSFEQTKEQVPYFFDLFHQDPNSSPYFTKRVHRDLVLYILDSGHISPHAGKQTEWLKSALSTHQDVRFHMAVYHVPLYPSVRFSQSGLLSRACCHLLKLVGRPTPNRDVYAPLSAEGIQHWVPLFDQYQVDIAFEHHDHALKRTKPLKNSAYHPYGTIYLGDGCWGPEKQAPPIQSYLSDTFEMAQGFDQCFWKVTLKNDQLLFEAINRKGKIKDQFTYEARKKWLP